MAHCNLTRSTYIGFFTALITYIFITLWIGLDEIKRQNVSLTTMCTLFLILFVAATSMDFINQCYTECNNKTSSLLYGITIVSLVYILYNLFIARIHIDTKSTLLFFINTSVIAIMHYAMCDYSHHQ